MDPLMLMKAHSGIAILVIVFYVIRGILMLSSSAKATSVVLTAVSHSLLLILILLGFYTAHLNGISLGNSFIISKLICLVTFAVMGGLALKKGLSKSVASILWLIGLASLICAWLLGKHVITPFF